MTPKLRFPEFKDEWQAKRIGDLLQIGSGRDYKHLESGNIPVYGTGGLMLYVNDYLYEGKSVGIGRKGTIDKPQWLDGKFWTVDTLFYTRDYKNSIPEFVYLLFQKINWLEHNEASGVPSLSKSTIEKIKVTIPSELEQQKIAGFLTVVDERVGGLERQVELLKKYKKGVMQKIFSQEIRLPGFEGAWPEKFIHELVNFIGGGTPSRSVSDYWQGDIPWVSSSDIPEDDIRSINYSRFITEDAVKKSATKIVPMGSLLVVSRVGVGKLAINDREVCTSQDFTNLVPEKIDLVFLAYYLKNKSSELLSFNQGTSIKGFTKDNLADLRIGVPQLEEQQKIADFLTSVDEKINLTQKELEQAKKFKQGLLQQMFV